MQVYLWQVIASNENLTGNSPASNLQVKCMQVMPGFSASYGWLVISLPHPISLFLANASVLGSV